ncbi:anti-sigma-I factor RsgI family protein [Desnuesiella massiliensis]|uniref:anti-sigma-I factor RsgI family protein n=1 Tax=Desnuesiella massiliensis TaxID=1650662 RepID=UPI0006E3FF56|nr:anti-sigma factor domain-containing protein [Desnuesiella massiliensis]
MTKTGIVMEINDSNIGILTPSGEFAYVKRNSKSVTMGELYSEEIFNGTKKKSINVKRLFLMAASFLLLVFLSSGIFLYNEPVSAVTIDINPSVELYVNRWNKIVKVVPLNDDGKNLVNELNIKNLDISNGIEKIYEKCKSENYITEDYKKDKAINIQVSNLKNHQLDLSKVEKKIEDDGINIIIDISKDKEIKKDNNSEKSTSPSEKENDNNSKTKENSNGNNKDKENNGKNKENGTFKDNNSNNKNVPEQKNTNNSELNQKDNNFGQSKDKGKGSDDKNNNKNDNKDKNDKNQPKEKDKKR